MFHLACWPRRTCHSSVRSCNFACGCVHSHAENDYRYIYRFLPDPLIYIRNPSSSPLERTDTSPVIGDFIHNHHSGQVFRNTNSGYSHRRASYAIGLRHRLRPWPVRGSCVVVVTVNGLEQTDTGNSGALTGCLLSA